MTSFYILNKKVDQMYNWDIEKQKLILVKEEGIIDQSSKDQIEEWVEPNKWKCGSSSINI